SRRGARRRRRRSRRARGGLGTARRGGRTRRPARLGARADGRGCARGAGRGGAAAAGSRARDREGAHRPLYGMGTTRAGVAMSGAPLVLATSLGDASGGPALAAALAVALARGREAAVFARPAERAPRPTLLASRGARELERSLREAGFEAAARGAYCEVRVPGEEGAEALARVR